MTSTFPETRLLTGDLLLRPYSAIDIEENQIACADPLIQQWLPLPQPYTRQDSADWCTKISHSLRETGDGIHFAIVDANTDRLLGTVGLKKTRPGQRDRLLDRPVGSRPRHRGRSHADHWSLATG